MYVHIILCKINVYSLTVYKNKTCFSAYTLELIYYGVIFHYSSISCEASPKPKKRFSHNFKKPKKPNLSFQKLKNNFKKSESINNTCSLIIQYKYSTMLLISY